MTSVNLHRSGEGSGPPLVLLPPFPFDARLWSRVRSLLTGPVIVVDPPGFGGAEATGTPSLEAYAQVLLEALDHVGVDRFVVAGNSMGGYAALALAALAPQRLAGIILIGT
ncbi:MAG: alpha/beta hydrolase [Propionibacteriaceae bacterium]|nr:alpha/beta hydrolase [Propionibacteriaceae bacterium]